MILFHSYVIAADGLNDFFAQDAVLTIPGRPEWPDSGSSFDGSNQSHQRARAPAIVHQTRLP